MISQLVKNKFEVEFKDKFMGHEFFKLTTGSPKVEVQDVEKFLGQYWHVLHYFPPFLSRIIERSTDLQVQTLVSKILYQELGTGDVKLSHELLFIETMKSAGFDLNILTNSQMNFATQKLMDGYFQSSAEYLSGIGYLYGTEAIDLIIVSRMGMAVKKVSGLKKLPWVDIHIQQEPEHTDCTEGMVKRDFNQEESLQILASAHLCWQRWIAFYDQLAFDIKYRIEKAG